jgi:glycosidase
MLILDVVFGHSDNQGLRASTSHYFAGPNMYGQNLDYQNPAVRAILLEMQRRKVDFGADGVRVDGAQDFKWWDPARRSCATTTTTCVHGRHRAEVAGTQYRPWFIFEDGRPWPDEDWELSSTYRAVIEGQRDPDVFQWGPLTFAHNTPFIYTFWLSKYWRIREILEVGRELDLGHRQPRHAAARHAGQPQAQHQHAARRDADGDPRQGL